MTQNPPRFQLKDRFGRIVDYLRLSVTDRCDFRCIYCMSEQMNFLPRQEILSLEELELVAKAFVQLGVKKIRVTGGEPLVRLWRLRPMAACWAKWPRSSKQVVFSESTSV